MSTIKTLAPFAVALAVISALLFVVLSLQPMQTMGSVIESQEYMSTTTAASTIYGSTITASKVIKAGQGSLAQVTITGANTGVVNFYNATTSNVSLRTGQKATSTILIASFPASVAAGTYLFDAQFTDGLYIDLVGGNMPTSSIMYR